MVGGRFWLSAGVFSVAVETRFIFQEETGFVYVRESFLFLTLPSETRGGQRTRSPTTTSTQYDPTHSFPVSSFSTVSVVDSPTARVSVES